MNDETSFIRFADLPQKGVDHNALKVRISTDTYLVINQSSQYSRRLLTGPNDAVPAGRNQLHTLRRKDAKGCPSARVNPEGP